MKNKFIFIEPLIGSLLAVLVIIYAISSYFLKQNKIITVPKKDIFTFDLTTQVNPAKTDPGDIFEVNPTIYNDLTENMYVYIRIIVIQTVINEDIFSIIE